MNPRALTKNLRILAAERAETGKDGHEVDPGGPHQGDGDRDGEPEWAGGLCAPRTIAAWVGADAGWRAWMVFGIAPGGTYGRTTPSTIASSTRRVSVAPS